MTQFPNDLALRLEKIFSPQENIEVKNIFQLKKRPQTARITYPESLKVRVLEEFHRKNISFKEAIFPENCIIFDNNISKHDIWQLECYKNWDIYLQWISSQIPVYSFSENRDTNLRILDACAAPGWKTMQLAERYPHAEIWAFEPHKIRYDKMCHNFQKFWHSNIKSIHDSIENLAEYISQESYFDMILIDAPCSWEGWLLLIHTKFLENWSLRHIKKNYKRQKSICDMVLPYLKTWGEMVYSTCTIAPEENEWVIHYLLCKYPELRLENIDFSNNKYIKTRQALKNFEAYSYKKEISEYALRVIPSEYSEWFFIAKISKWISIKKI